MLHIVVICVGKLNQRHWKLAFEEYYKRLQISSKIKIVTIDEINSTKNISVNLKLEAQKINFLLAKYLDYQCFLLDLTGKLISSEELAQIIIKNQSFHQGKILFIIGGSNGVSDEKKYPTQVSFWTHYFTTSISASDTFRTALSCITNY